MKPDFLSIALNEAKQGRPVFPCRGKVPLTPNGVSDATPDEATIRQWAKQYPNANCAVAFNENTREIGLDVKRIVLTMERAREMGFINLNALSNYC